MSNCSRLAHLSLLVASLPALACAAAPAEPRADTRADAPATHAAARVAAPPTADGPRNVIYMIADGMGPASTTMARTFHGSPLALDPLFVGSVTTQPLGQGVTDSAAAATALACGVKTTNGAIAVLPDGTPVPTLLERAEERGMVTGLVVTSTITHATPACFVAHVRSRLQENEIAVQLLEHDVEVLFGGGRGAFTPKTAGGNRGDGLDLLERAARAGYRVVDSRADFEDLDDVPVLALFSLSHLPFEIDRDPELRPSLAEMTAKALELLGARDEGFFLMIEGSRIDHAAHGNDAAAHVRDILAYDAAVQVALDFARRDGHTLLVSTADHETGGMTLGRELDSVSHYDWFPDVLRRVQASVGAIWYELGQGAELRALLAERTGLTDLPDATLAELQGLAAAQDSGGFQVALAQLISNAALIGWTTHGHTGVDVGLYAFGPGEERFHGVLDNTEVARNIADLFGFELSGP